MATKIIPTRRPRGTRQTAVCNQCATHFTYTPCDTRTVDVTDGDRYEAGYYLFTRTTVKCPKCRWMAVEVSRTVDTEKRRHAVIARQYEIEAENADRRY